MTALDMQNERMGVQHTAWKARLGLIRSVWILVAILAVILTITALPGYLMRINMGVPTHGPATTPLPYFSIMQIASAAASLFSSILSFFIAALLFRHRLENPAVAAASFYLLLYSVVMTGPLEFWEAYWLEPGQLAITAQTLLMGTPTLALLLLFPDGQFVPRWGRWVLLASLPWNLLPFFFPISPQASNNVTGLIILALTWMSLLSIGIYTQHYRYTHISTVEEKQQTRWVLYGFALWIGYMLLSTIPFLILNNLPADAEQPWWGSISSLGWWISLSILPASLAIAITRGKLWNIQFILNRTLVYGALSFSTIALYILVVGVLGNVLQPTNTGLVPFLTTGLIAILFHPLRMRLQQAINRLMFGERDDPSAVLKRLGTALESTGSPEETLISITETVSHALKLPYVAILLEESDSPAVSYGIPRANVTKLPMGYQGEVIGHLLVAPRSQDEQFSASELGLLENIARQAGASAYAARLTNDLRQSRQRLVTAREEERRRLRRDLHDGLGPNLASLALKLDAARNLLASDPSKTATYLEDLKKQLQETIKDIRHLVYALRPPALDELGLAGAVKSHIENQVPASLKVALHFPSVLPTLPAAVEVAAYRIILEGLTNTLRHANASQAEVTLRHIPGELMIQIHDNGTGAEPGTQRGIGLRSMQERAEELGGTFEILWDQPGFHLIARLPSPKE